MRLDVTLIAGDRSQAAAIEVNSCVIAGWTGRNAQAVAHHIQELADMGVAPPASTPTYYHVTANRLTTATSISVIGADSSGEVEFVVLRYDGRLWIGTGSDHTDRRLETFDVTLSKQVCEKPVAPVFWLFDDLKPHWQELMLHSRAVIDGIEADYQHGPVTTMRDPQELLDLYHHNGAGLAEGGMMYCGTLAAIGGIRFGSRFSFSLTDPVLNRNISHSYDIQVLTPVALAAMREPA